MERKYRKLIASIKELGSLAVAFSGGVDSSFLLKAAREALGEEGSLLAITASSCLFPRTESREAEEFCKKEGIRQIIIEPAPLEIEGFSANPPDRCYLCKKALFKGFLERARKEGFDQLAEGSNMDDLSDYRPGMKAISELGILSPLRQAGLYKEEIRVLSEKMGLTSWNKPSFACLASRIPYGDEITADKLSMVEEAENYLAGLGFGQRRVRLYGRLAKIEVPREDTDRVIERKEEIIKAFKAFGFLSVAVDLEGYRSGSMNRGIIADSLPADQL